MAVVLRINHLAVMPMHVARIVLILWHVMIVRHTVVLWNIHTPPVVVLGKLIHVAVLRAEEIVSVKIASVLISGGIGVRYRIGS